MLQLFKKSWWVILLAASMQNAAPFALMGPAEPYHIRALGYYISWDQPKNIDAGHRWTIPKIYYSYDSSFLSYFGSNGVYSVDEGIRVLNNLTNVSAITNLDVFPLESMQVNYSAAAMRLLDVKSVTMFLFLQRLGLASAEQFVWTLRGRALSPGAACPDYDYTVIKRNFDPDTLAPSSYVNGNLFTYFIQEWCPTPSEAEAIEQLVDPTGNYFSTVASGSMWWGNYHTGLTRDDVGGLRHLYKPNNFFDTAAGQNTFTYATNTSLVELLVTSNATEFASQALTNNAATLQTLYPNLVILNTTNTFVNYWITNLIAYYTNFPMDPYGTPPRLVFATNLTPAVLPTYQHSFANLYTVSNYQNRLYGVPLPTIHNRVGQHLVTIQTAYTTNKPFAPYGTVVTNISNKTYSTNMVGGEYFILPTNACSISIIALQNTFTNLATNIIVSATNSLVIDTNNVGSSNVAFYAQSLITYTTNHAYLINPVTCDTNSVAVRGGIDKVSFVRRDFDSLLNRFFYPITNTYYLMALTNYTLVTQTVQRVVTSPDILIEAADMAHTGGPTSWPLDNGATYITVHNFVTVGVTNGPGTIEPFVNLTFNKVGPMFRNYGPFFIDERTAELDYIWASYDGSTNAPVIYPIGSSVDNLTNQFFLYIANPVIPNATAGHPYAEQLVAGGSGGTPPYSFALAPQSAALPPGFSLTAQGMIIANQPWLMRPNIYDFVVRMTDATAKFVDRAFTLTVLPP